MSNRLPASSVLIGCLWLIACGVVAVTIYGTLPILERKKNAVAAAQRADLRSADTLGSCVKVLRTEEVGVIIDTHMIIGTYIIRMDRGVEHQPRYEEATFMRSELIRVENIE